MNSIFLDPELSEIAPLLYVPAVREDLAVILSGQKITGVCALAICLEDAIRPDERAAATRRAAAVLSAMEQRPPRPVFVRPADLDTLNLLLDTTPLRLLAGIILPKATQEDIAIWTDALAGALPLLPIMESRQALDPVGRRDLAQACWQHRACIPRVRIGANDLLRLLGGLRRPARCTIYETPAGRVIDALIESFAGTGIPLCGTAFDRLDDADTLRLETAQDIGRGLLAKTALNPAQAAMIWAQLAPLPEEVEEARCILAPDAPAVFGLHGSMHEPACHRDWARRLLRRADLHARGNSAAGLAMKAQPADCRT